MLLFNTPNSPQAGQWIDFEVYADPSVQDIHRQKPHYLTIAASEPVANINVSREVIHSNENITRLDNEPVTDSGLPSTWQDPNKSCSSSFKCIADFSTGWNDKESIQISTPNTKRNTFSNIIGEE